MRKALPSFYRIYAHLYGCAFQHKRTERDVTFKGGIPSAVVLLLLKHKRYLRALFCFLTLTVPFPRYYN